MTPGVSHWALIGTLYLIFLTYQDYKNKRIVDDRHNYMMMGATFMLFSHFHIKLWFIFVMIGITIGLHYFLNKIKSFGRADNKTISWIFLGLAIINLGYVVFFFLILSIVSLIFLIFKKYVFKYKEPVPYYGIILICFVLNGFLLGFY